MRIKLLVLALFFTNQVWAQGSYAIGGGSQATVGVRAGTGFNQFTRPGTFIGFTGGAFVKYSVANFLDVKVEALYSQQGGKLPDYRNEFDEALLANPNLSSVTHIDPYVSLANLEIPILVDLGIGSTKGSVVEPRLTLGGSYNFLISANEHFTKQYVFDDGTMISRAYRRENVGSGYVQNQWNIIAGLGMNYNLGKRTFFMDVRYRQGVTQLNTMRFAKPERGGSLYSSTLSINFGMTIFNLLY